VSYIGLRTLHPHFCFYLIIIIKMNLFDNLSFLLEWTKYSSEEEDSDLGLDKVVPYDFNVSTPLSP